LAADPPATELAEPTDLQAQFVMAKVEKDSVVWSVTRNQAVKVTVNQTVIVGGQPMLVPVTRESLQSTPFKQSRLVKNVKAFRGKSPIAADALAVLLIHETPVVMVQGPIPAKFAALLKDDAIVIELPIPPKPTAVPGAAPKTLPRPVPKT
jgi:hypothetical protein